MQVFEYGADVIAHLKSRDKLLGSAMDRICIIRREGVIAVHTSLRGVGFWTAEMILLFSLGRTDIVSYRDLAIRRGMMNLYGLQSLTPVVFEQYRKCYSPYGSVASLYLWALS